MMSTPMDTQTSATSGFMVSTDTGTSVTGTSSLRTDFRRRISSSADTGEDPGRVDSAPTSMIDAPCSAISTA